MDRDPTSAAEDDPTSSRNTLLAAERTWLAWWRTALACTAMSAAIGRLLPSLSHATRWPFTAVGAGYGVLAVAVIIAGATRQHQNAQELARGGFRLLPMSYVAALTVSALVLGVATIALVLAGI